jgi:hypothetical protein
MNKNIKISREAEKLKRLLIKIEKDQKVLEYAEHFQREIGCISIQNLLKQFNI